MARLWASGFEQNTIQQGNEWGIVADNPTVVSSPVRSGGFAGRISSLTSAVAKLFGQQFVAADANGAFFVRVCVNVVTLPSAANQIIRLTRNTAGMIVAVDLNSDGTLQLRDEDGTIGSPSAALSVGTNTWYRIELEYNRTGASGSHIVKARLEGTQFAGATNRALSQGLSQIRIGGNLAAEAQTVGEWLFDDIAVNDSTTSVQNSYPGDGKIIHRRPNAAGDVNTFATQTGGTAGAGNNFTRVNEVPPNDATSFNGSSTLNQEDLFNIDDSGIGASDVVNVVQVGVRFRNNTADATTALTLEAMKASGGTKAAGSALVPNTVSWLSPSSIVTTRAFSLTMHQDPDAANWTQATLDTMQIGYKLTAANVNRVDVSAVWALIDYTPNTARSGTGTITAATSVTGTEKTARAGTSTITASTAVTGTKSTARFGTATITAATAVSGTRAANRLGAGTVTAATSVTGTRLAARAGTGAIASTTGVTSSATTTRAGAGTITPTSTVTGSETASRAGTSSIAASTSVTQTGVHNRNGTSTITCTTNTAVTGAAARFGTSTITAASSVTGAAMSGENHSGAGSISQATLVTGEGFHGSLSPGAITAAASVTANGAGQRAGVGTCPSTVPFIVFGTTQRFGTSTTTVGWTFTVSGVALVTGQPLEVREPTSVILSAAAASRGFALAGSGVQSVIPTP